MKTSLLVFALFFSLQTHANQDHEAGMEADPGEARLAETRACFNALDEAGCGRPADDREHFSECAVDRKTDLQSGCQKLVKKLYQ